MILPNPPIGVLCDINEAWKLNLELLEAGVRCHSGQESRFKKGYKLTSHVGLLWCYSKGIAPLLPGYAHFAVSMPEFRTAFGLNPKPQPNP